jgi:hypothetical protein
LSLDRSEFLRLGAASALAGLLGGAGTAAAQDPAAPAPQGDDIGYVQWGATAELLSVAFYTQALRSGEFSARVERRLRAARDADREHLAKLNAVLGEDAPTEDDFEIELPARAFRSEARVLNLGMQIETRVTGVYLDGVARTSDQPTRLLLGRLLLSDGQHLTMLRALAGETGDGGLRNPVRVETAGAWLDRYLRSRSFPTR